MATLLTIIGMLLFATAGPPLILGHNTSGTIRYNWLLSLMLLGGFLATLGVLL